MRLHVVLPTLGAAALVLACGGRIETTESDPLPDAPLPVPAEGQVGPEQAPPETAEGFSYAESSDIPTDSIAVSDAPTSCTGDRFDVDVVLEQVMRARVTESWDLQLSFEAQPVTVHHFAVPPEAVTQDAEGSYGSEPYSTVREAGDWVAAQVTWSVDGTASWEAVLADSSGAVRWILRGTDDTLLWQIGPAGHVVLRQNGAADISIVNRFGTRREVLGARPIAAPDAAGVLPVELREPGVEPWQPYSLGWLDAETALSTPFARPTPRDTDYCVRDEGRHFTYLVDGADGVDLAIESRTETRAIPLVATVGARLITCDASSAIVAHETGVLVVDVISGVVSEFSLPPGLDPIGYDYYWGFRPSIEADGRLTLVGRDDYAAGVFSANAPEAPWTLVGTGFRDVTEVGYFTRGGTYVVGATDVSIYVPDFPWLAVPDGREAPHVGPGNELVRPDDGIELLLPDDWQSLELSRDGLCLRFETAAETYVFEVVNGSVHRLPGDAGVD